MKVVSTTIRRVLEMFSFRASRVQIHAVALMAGMLMPIAAPIPAWGYELNLPPMPAVNEVPLAPAMSLSPSSVWARLNERFDDATSLIGEMAGEEPAERDARRSAKHATDLNARVKDIETRLEPTVELNVGESLVLSAVPLDDSGVPVHGVTPKWTSKNYSLVQIDGDRAVALALGETQISVRAGDVVETVAIKIVTVASDAPAPASSKAVAAEAETETKVEGNSAPSIAGPMQPAMLTIPDGNTRESSYSPENNVGAPAKVTEMDSPNDTTAARIRHRAGIANYNFSIPFASLTGRGIDASVGMTYNSRVWNKNGDGTNASYQFNVDQNWLAPGFTFGYGKLTSHFANQAVIMTNNQYKMFNHVVPEGYTDGNGTRHRLECKVEATIPNTKTNLPNKYCAEYGTADGSFVRVLYHGNRPLSPYLQDDLSAYATTYFTLIHSDGTRLIYSVPGAQFGPTDYAREHYPNVIQDRNGNQINVAYKDGKDKIEYVRDTLGRYIRFHYETGNDKKLVAVTVPSFNGGADRQTVRLYYEDVTFTPQGRFSGIAIIPNPSTFQTLKYVYFPSTGSGFRYDYHPNFGMIKKITKLAGMTVDNTSTSSTGAVTNEGTAAATTEYLYPNDGSTTPLTDVPKYTQRTDDWLGRTTSGPALTYYDAPEPGTGADQVSTVTVPEQDFDVDYKSVAHNTTDWKNGLIKETSVIKRYGPTRQYTALMAKTAYTWIEGLPDSAGRKAPVVSNAEITNDAGQTKAQTFSYDLYGNQTVKRDHDFAAAGTTGTELRRTETTFVSGPTWLNNGLSHLPEKVETIVGSTVISKTVLEYDNYTSTALAQTPGVIQHDAFYSAQPGTHPCNPHYDCSAGDYPPHCPMVYDECPNSDPAASYRGNVTKVTVWADPSQGNDPARSIRSFTYDITGNVLTETAASCCNLKTLEYSAANYYAYPTKMTRGGSPNELVTEAEYNFHTGLVVNITDENGNNTVNTYDPVTLRQTRVDHPNGAWTTYEFNDTSYPFSVKSTGSLDATRSLANWSFVNGIGQAFRSRSLSASGYLSKDTEYDNTGRPIKAYDAYTVGNLSDPRPGSGVASIEVTKLDPLGRVIEKKFQDLTTITSEYSGVVTTATDQAGRKRRQLVDALGRTIRVDEPVSSPPDGDPLGPVGSPHQPTNYEYDANNNLTKVIQAGNGATQERVFKYDGKSQLTHERHVEATKTLDDLGIKQPSGGSWTGFSKYTSEGLLDYTVDPRGVKSDFSYDELNRVVGVVYTGETGYETPAVTYTYGESEGGFSNIGQLTKVQTAPVPAYGVPATEQHYDYDAVGQVKKQVQIIGSQTYSLEYGYNLAGQLVTQKYPSGKVINNAVDNFGIVQTVSDSQRNYLNGVTIDTKGQVSQLNFGNSSSEAFTYNNRHQLESQTLSRGTTVLQKYNYNYGDLNPSGALKNNGKLEQIESYIGTAKQWTQKQKYDPLGRLKEAEERRGDTNALTYKQVFDYDRFGNLYRKAASNPTTGQENPLPTNWIEDSHIDRAKNQLHASTGVSYNEAGQIITDNKWRSAGFTYDANGRVVKTTRAGSPDAQTVYDANGSRIATKIDNVWQYMVYDAFGKLAAEYGVHGSGAGGVNYIQQDHQGSVRTVTNAAGAVIARADFQAFGERIGAGVGLRTSGQKYAGDTVAKQTYALTEDDDASGQQHAGYRKLETQGGRWSSPDPYNGSMVVGNPQSFNRYSYVENDPTNSVDPSGLMRSICHAESGGGFFCSGGWSSGGGFYNYNPNAPGSGYYGADAGYGTITITTTLTWDPGSAEERVYTHTSVYTFNFSQFAGFSGVGGCGAEDPGAGNAPGEVSDGWCNTGCLKNEERECENRARNYFNDNVSWNVIKDVLGLPGSLAALDTLRKMSIKRMITIAASKVFWIATVLSAVYAVYDTTQQAVAIENECRRKIPDKCGEGCKKYIGTVGRV